MIENISSYLNKQDCIITLVLLLKMCFWDLLRQTWDIYIVGANLNLSQGYLRELSKVKFS